MKNRSREKTFFGGVEVKSVFFSLSFFSLPSLQKKNPKPHINPLQLLLPPQCSSLAGLAGEEGKDLPNAERDGEAGRLAAEEEETEAAVAAAAARSGVVEQGVVEGSCRWRTPPNSLCRRRSGAEGGADAAAVAFGESIDVRFWFWEDEEEKSGGLGGCRRL